MKTPRAIIVRCRNWFQRRRIEAEMRAELEAHLEALVERNLAAGMTPAEARRAAVRVFGGVEQVAERARDERRSVWLEQAAQDVRYALRALAKSPSFSITAVLTIALGIGVNAGLFTLFNTVALRAPAVTDPDGLVRIAGLNARGAVVSRFGYAEFLGYRDGSRTLEGLLAFRETSWEIQDVDGVVVDPAFDLGGLGVVAVELVSENYFSLLGGRIQLGRGFRPEEVGTPGEAAVIVLSDAFWASHYQRDPDVIGTTLRLHRRIVTIIGVAAETFTGHRPVSPAGWLPLTMASNNPDDYAANGPQQLQLIGRLQPGVSDEQAKADLESIAVAQAAAWPGESAKVSVRLERGLQFVRFNRSPQGKVAVALLFLGFALVLVIACTNVANLLLARGVSRRAEIAVRLTLGAGRGRIVRQLLTENGVLCVIGAVVGLGLGTWTLQVVQPLVLAPYMSGEWLRFLQPKLDLYVVGFTALLTLGTTLVTGLLPAWHTAGTNLVGAMHRDGTSGGRWFGGSSLRRLLVISQVAVCLMLLSCAGIFVRQFYILRPAEPDAGAAAEVLRASVWSRNSETDGAAAFRQAVEVVRSLPGVFDASVVRGLPVLEGGLKARIRSGEAPTAGTGDEMRAVFVTEGYFATFRQSLLRGRSFRELEQVAESRVVLVSESLARRLWQDGEVVGRSLAVSEATWSEGERRAPEDAFRECEVIGVVPDVAPLVAGPGETGDDRGLIYLPLAWETVRRAQVYIRPRADSAAALAELVRSAEAHGVGLRFEQRLSDVLATAKLPFNAMSILTGSLGLLALGMATLGLYGLMTFVVSQRVREVGIRMALGATAGRVVALIVRQGMRLVTVGIAVGLAGGALLALVLEKLFIGMLQAWDPMAFGGVTLLFAAIALIACWLPARSAAKVDPVVALRAE